MSSDTSGATRRIMNSLGEERRIPVLNIEEGDIGVLFGFPIGGLFVASLTGTDSLVIPLVLVGVVVGTAAVVAAPSHRNAWQWLRDLARFYLARPRVTLLRTSDSDHASTDGGLAQYSPFTPDERTQDLTGIERAWPGAGAIQRHDGTMEGFIEVTPSNMDFAMSGDWQQIQEAAAGFANTELDFPITFHATTRSYPADQLVEQLDDRLDDPDVDANPAFRELLEEYSEQRPAELADTRELYYYLGVEVREIDVYQRQRAEGTPGEKLANLPLVGVLFTPFVTRREDYEQAEQRAAMFDRLDDRLRTVRSEFIEDVPGWSATRLSTLELFTLNADFWNGTEHDPETDDYLLRERAAVGRQSRNGTGEQPGERT